jgi:Rrf2 family protein
MKLQQKVRYGVACLYELSKHPGEYLDTETLTKTQNIPCAFAHKILQQLCHAGLVIAHKGLGYKLARPLENITAAEIIDVLTADTETPTGNSDIGVLLENRIHKALSSFTLGELFQTV